MCARQRDPQQRGEPSHHPLRLPASAHLRVGLRHGGAHVLQVLSTDHNTRRTWSRYHSRCAVISISLSPVFHFQEQHRLRDEMYAPNATLLQLKCI